MVTSREKVDEDKLESFESLIAGLCVNARAASDFREATRITVQTLLYEEFWTAFTKARLGEATVE